MRNDAIKTKSLGWVTEQELREIYSANGEIEQDIREWLRYSDGEFAVEQIDELRDVIRFETDAWDNVYAWPNVSTDNTTPLTEAVRNSIYSYPSTIEDALCKLERYQEGVDRLYYEIPSHFEKAIEKQLEVVCDEYAKCLKADFQWWMDAKSDELFESYFMDDVDGWMEKHWDIADEFVDAKYGARNRHKKAVRATRNVFRKSFPKRKRTAM